MAKKPLEIDMIAGSQLRDTQGEMLSVEGADISELEAGRGRFNDNHAKGFYNSLGRVTSAKKILSKDDCSTDRHSYFWDKIKAPFIYCRGVLYDDEEHPNAKAAAAILRNIHNSDSPLQLKASVEGGVVARGIKDDRLLARTKIHSVALTFTPANNATLVEPFEMTKSSSYEEDMILIKSVMHLASKSDVPSFRHITRRASATKVSNNFNKINQMAQELGLKSRVSNPGQDNIVKSSVEQKIIDSVEKTSHIIKAEKIKAKIQHINSSANDLFKAFEALHDHSLKTYKIGYSKKNKEFGDDKTWLKEAINRHTEGVNHPEDGRMHKDLLNYLSAAQKDPSKFAEIPKKPTTEFGEDEQAKIPDSATKPSRMVTRADRAPQEGAQQLPMKKALTAGYGGAGAPTNLSGGGVIQSEGLDDGRGKTKKNEENSNSFKYLLCPNCGHEQIYMNHQVKCRDCNKHLPMSVLATAMMGKKKK